MNGPIIDIKLSDEPINYDTECKQMADKVLEAAAIARTINFLATEAYLREIALSLRAPFSNLGLRPLAGVSRETKENK